jgi:hypothetical protein
MPKKDRIREAAQSIAKSTEHKAKLDPATITSFAMLLMNLIEMFKKCREEDAGETAAQAVKRMAANRQMNAVRQTRKHVRRELRIRGRKAVHAKADEILEEIANTDDDQIDIVLQAYDAR